MPYNIWFLLDTSSILHYGISTLNVMNVPYNFWLKDETAGHHV
jgi:hypothetical protein